MKCISRWLAVIVLLLGPVGFLSAEKVSTLPAPTGFVNDFAGVLSPSVKQSVEDLCVQVDRQAHAQIAVVTVKTIDDDISIEEFATALQDKWKVGAKGTDRGVLMLFVMKPRRGRIEVGYGLEGILNDAKVGDIGRSMVPAAAQGDYDTAIPLGVRQIAQVIATDAGVTLTQPIHQYHRQVQQQPVHISLTQLVLGGAAIVLILFFLIKTGNIGLIFFLLANIMGGGRGGRGRDRDDGGGGGGFGGFGGGSSGGGGASGDF
jgi:uncharacterized protein